MFGSLNFYPYLYHKLNTKRNVNMKINKFAVKQNRDLVLQTVNNAEKISAVDRIYLSDAQNILFEGQDIDKVDTLLDLEHKLKKIWKDSSFSNFPILGFYMLCYSLPEIGGYETRFVTSNDGDITYTLE